MPSKDRNAMLIEAGLALSSELSLPAVLQRIVDLAVEVTDARYGALGVIGENSRIADFLVSGLSQEDRERIGALPVGRGILGALMTDEAPLRLADISKDPRAVGFPSHHPRMRSFLGAPIKARGRVFGNIYLTDKRGADEFDEEDERALVVLATQAGVAIENARLYEESRKRERLLDSVREIATAILVGAEADAALELIARRARELVGADLATIGVPAHDEVDSLVLQVVVGEHADVLQGWKFPIEGSVSGEVIRTGRPIVLEDAASDGRAYQPIIQLGDIGPAIFVPLGAGRPFGTVAVANLHGGRTFGDADLALVQALAGQAAVALEYARAQDELQRLAVMEDRERIAKELHDGAIQSLFAVGMGLQATAAISENEDIESRVEEAVADVDRVIRDLRNYIFGLRPGILADRQLDQALRALAADFETKTGIAAAVDIDGNLAAELAARAADVVQLTREALSNVGRHSGAETCRVSLRRDGKQAVLSIEDDGKGFDPASTIGGSGLGNIRGRAEGLGGTADVETSPGEGTTVRVAIPV